MLLTAELAVILFFSMRPAVDPDYGWHVTNGEHVIDGKIFGGRDIYSWTATNLWIAHEWATEAVMGYVHRHFGASANSVIAACVGLATYAVVVSRLRNKQFGRSSILIALPVVFVGSMRSIGVRPLMLELLYLSILLAAIDGYLERRFSRWVGAGIVFAFGVLWANTHGSFVLLPVVLWITSAELKISGDRRWVDFAAGGATAAAAALLNPWGFQIFGFAIQSISSEATLAYIDEWKRPVLTEALAIPLLLQSALALVGISRVLRLSGSRVGILRTLAFGYLAFSSGRHIMLFGIAAAEMIAAGIQPVGDSISRRITQSRYSQADPRRAVINLIAAVAIAVLIPRAGWLAVSPAAQVKAMSASYPVGISLHSNITSSDKLFNEYRWGGYLIMNDVTPVFIDGRSELYGDDLLRQYASIVHLESGWQERLRSLGITKILMPQKSALANAVTKSGWIPVAHDSVGVLFKSPDH